ncbi:MAG: Rrf2 family transcriptional regulator [Planctomycetes bacterium]|nr:Rrf2 family transcriptional regulator [Planctomycetota bacterium]
MFSRQTVCAFTAMSRLAEVYDGGHTALSAAEIAASRGIPCPFVAKTLSALSRAGFVIGSRGPNGGYVLSSRPETITLLDVYQLFESSRENSHCPLDMSCCDLDQACALHEKIASVRETLNDFLRKTTFVAFHIPSTTAMPDEDIAPQLGSTATG